PRRPSRPTVRGRARRRPRGTHPPVRRARIPTPARSTRGPARARRRRSRWRVASGAKPPAASASTGPLSARSPGRSTSSGRSPPSPLPPLPDQARDPIELVIRDARRLPAEQRGNGLLRRSLEERVDDVAERRLARGVPRHRGRVDVAQPLFLVPDVPFVLE